VAIEAALGGWQGWFDENLPAIADFVATRLVSGGEAPDGTDPVAQAAAWTAESLAENGEGIEQATAWLEKLPPGAAQEAAIAGIVSAASWQPAKQQDLGAWISTLPPSRERDLAAAGLASKISAKDPAGALQWAAGIDDSALRSEALTLAGARFIPREVGGTKPFDLEKWESENPGIAAELRAAAARD